MEYDWELYKRSHTIGNASSRWTGTQIENSTQRHHQESEKSMPRETEKHSLIHLTIEGKQVGGPSPGERDQKNLKKVQWYSLKDGNGVMSFFCFDFLAVGVVLISHVLVRLTSRLQLDTFQSSQLWILRKSKCFKHALVISVFNLRRKSVFGTVAHLALCASAPPSFFLSYHTVVVCLCAHSQHHVTDSSDRFMAQEQNSVHPFIIFHQLGSGAHGTGPCWTSASGYRAGSSERPSANRVQRTDHYSFVKFRFSARLETEPQGSSETLATAIRWKPSLTMVTLRFGCRAMRQSYHVMDMVVRCWEKWPSRKSLKTTRLKPWGGPSGMSNNWVQLWQLL